MTEADFPKLLSELEGLAHKLNAESNSINIIIDSVESRLQAANPGIECWLCPLQAEDEDGAGDSGELGFAKLSGTWRLFIKNRTHKYVVSSELVPLSQTSRALRIAALRELPRLIEAITQKVRDNVQAIEDAKHLVF